MTNNTQTTAMLTALENGDFDSARAILNQAFDNLAGYNSSITSLARWTIDNAGIDFDAIGCMDDWSDAIKARLSGVWSAFDRNDDNENKWKKFNTIVQREAKDLNCGLSIKRAKNGKQAGAKFVFETVKIEWRDFDADKQAAADKRAAKQAEAEAAIAEQAVEDLNAADILALMDKELTKQPQILKALKLLVGKASPATKAKLLAMLATEETAADETAAA